MADTSLLFNILAKDKTRSTLNGVGKRIGVMGVAAGAALGGVAAAAATAGVGIAIDFGKKSIDAFTAAEASAVKFDDAFSRAKGLGPYKERIDELAQSLALKTKYDDDATKASAALLAKFDLTGQQIETLIPLVQDYAAYTGKDLGSASAAVGKALLGNVRALKELGITYKPTGDRAKDFANIQALLNDKVGGFAEKQGKSAAGQSEILANQFGELQEQIGSWLVPALQKFTSWMVQYVIPAVQKAADWIGKNLGPTVAKLGKWITGTAVPALQQFSKTFMRDVWPAILQVYKTVWNNLKPAIDSLAELWRDSLQPALVQAMPYIQAWAKWFGITWGAAMTLVSFIIGKVVPVIALLVGHIVKITQLQGKVVAAFAGMAQGIYNAFRGAFNGIAALWNSTVGRLSFSLPDWIPGIGGRGFDMPDIPMLANGGTAVRAGLALVGERGPEVISMPRGATVTPLTGKGAGMHIENLIVQSAPGERAEQSVPRALRRTAFELGMGVA